MSENQKMNRHQRRRWQANFRKAKLEVVRKAKEGTPTGPCDWPGCQTSWEFVVMANVQGVRKPVARRCWPHRLGSANVENLEG